MSRYCRNSLPSRRSARRAALRSLSGAVLLPNFAPGSPKNRARSKICDKRTFLKFMRSYLFYRRTVAHAVCAWLLSLPAHSAGDGHAPANVREGAARAPLFFRTFTKPRRPLFLRNLLSKSDWRPPRVRGLFLPPFPPFSRRRAPFFPVNWKIFRCGRID